MKGKNKTLFIAGIAVACVAYAVKHSTKEDKFYFGNLKESKPFEENVNSDDVPDLEDLF